MAESRHLHYHLFVRERVLRYIRERGLMHAGDRVCVAVSGGADSVALLRVLLELRGELGIVLSVAHFNHGLRGEASDADEAFVAELARQHNLEFFSGRGDVRDHALGCKSSLEAAARELRYRSLTSLAESNKLNAIATGHTLDDQAETVLLRFLRGAGTRGLAGIYPEIVIGADEGVLQRRIGLRPCNEADENRARTGQKSLAQHDTSSPIRARIIRPLLGVTREEVEQYLTALGQAWREDESNLDHRFTRNRVRHELLPLLEREYNPNIRQVLSDTAELSRAEEEYWQGQVEWELDSRVHPQPRERKTEMPQGPKPKTPVVSDGTAEEAAEKVVARTRNRRFLGAEAPRNDKNKGFTTAHPSAGSGQALKVRPFKTGPETTFSAASEAVPLQSSAAKHYLSPPEQHLGLVNFHALPLALQRRLLKNLLDGQQIPADFEHIEKLLRCALGELPKVELPGGWLATRQGECLELRAPRAEAPISGYQYTLPVPGEVRIEELGLTLRSIPVPEQLAGENNSPERLLNVKLLGRELEVRNWRPGDRFWPVHSKSEEKLKRLFSERHIPAGQRFGWPVVLYDSQIAWVHGFPAARAFAWSGSGDAVKIELLG